MFHLITHAFFKALLFLGAGSVIHGCHGEQDIRRMGGLRAHLPVTFLTYAVGALSLSGFPLLFSGFWSKDEILHGAHAWQPSHWPFYLGLAAALLTAFYMMRQVAYAFLNHRADPQSAPAGEPHAKPHESPRVMLGPLIILAIFAVGLGFLGTPAWPWFQSFISGELPVRNPAALLRAENLGIMAASAVVALLGLGTGFFLYRNLPTRQLADPLARFQPDVYTLLERKYFVDEAYEASIVRFAAWWARACGWLERWVLDLLTGAASLIVVGLGWASRLVDEFAVNAGFDRSCEGLSRGGWLISRFQNGHVQRYLRALAVGLVFLIILLAWGCARR
jgi:NADH-quinone oxidoreductase subunit L